MIAEDDIILDDQLISVIKGASDRNTKRGAIRGNNFRWPQSMEKGKRVVIVPYKLESK